MRSLLRSFKVQYARVDGWSYAILFVPELIIPADRVLFCSSLNCHFGLFEYGLVNFLEGIIVEVASVYQSEVGWHNTRRQPAKTGDGLDAQHGLCRACKSAVAFYVHTRINGCLGFAVFVFVGVVVSRLCGVQAFRCAGVRNKIRQLAAWCPDKQSAIKSGKVDKLTRILWKLNSPARLSKLVVREDIEKHVRGTDPFVTCDRATEIHDAVVAGQAIARLQLGYEYASSAADSE